VSEPRFWRSIEEYQNSDAFGDMLRAEFPSLFELWQVDRRELLRVMGASLALAGMCGCTPERSNDAVPFVNRPDGFLEGRVEHYATAVPFNGYAQPVLATTSAGRPIKLDGNPDHPAVRGGSSPFMQAAILDLYDPDRSQAPLKANQPASWAEFEGAMARWRTAWADSRGAGLRLLIGPTTSPTLLRQLAELKSNLPLAKVHLFDPLTGYGPGAAGEWLIRLDRARVVVSLDDDFLGPGPSQVTNARAWAGRRGDVARSERLKLFVAEPSPTQTGANANDRLAIPPSRLAAVAQAIAAGVGVAGAQVQLTPAELAWVKRAADALKAAAGQSLLTAGHHCAAAVQALAVEVNRQLGNIGRTCDLVEPVAFVPEAGGSFLDLLRDIGAGQVSTLFVLDSNPAYAAPAELNFAGLYRRVPLRIHAGMYADETAELSNWHVPLPHALEDWSDARTPEGTATIVQPVIRPLYDTRSLHAIVDGMTAVEPRYPRDLVRETWAGRLTGDAWPAALKRGFVEMPAAAIQPLPQRQSLDEGLSLPKEGEVEILFRPDPTILDGRHANNGWLQELPKPLFKTTWDNVVAVSPALARALKLESGDMVEVECGGRAINGPAWVLPGQPERVVTLFLGYGRRRAGKVGNDIGYDAYALLSARNPWVGIGQIRRTGARGELAATQMHHLMTGEGADLVRTVTPEEPFARREQDSDQESMYSPWPDNDPSWGMVIDLDRCIGCNACVTACQAENNVPVVGKDQVSKGREMHWLRVDRYYAGEADDPETFFEPVPCMHCEQAPCEMGCPVHATVHSPDGLNLMVYNRCIGTRTCSSYCPYKVRRFNWFDYTSDAPESIVAQRNPDVTVRGRGVMEKCNYCIQRISAAQVKADIEERPIRDGEVKTACQQACPAEAISFGNLADRKSEVRAKRSSPRNYSLLAELGTRPRTTYLARVADKAEDVDGE
jgi:molybdopterin-containing oxidoreductase family iron-sulfur binding subunit